MDTARGKHSTLKGRRGAHLTTKGLAYIGCLSSDSVKKLGVHSRKRRIQEQALSSDGSQQLTNKQILDMKRVACLLIVQLICAEMAKSQELLQHLTTRLASSSIW